MRTRLLLAATIMSAAALGFGAFSSDQAAEATPVSATAPLDLSAYIDLPDTSTQHHSGSCTVVNPGTPFCYMRCDRPPHLRTCEEG